MENKIVEQCGFKAHWKKHWKAYVCCGVTAVGVAGITYLIVKSEKLHITGDTPGEKLHITGDTGFINQGTIKNSVVNVFEREGRGHPGYMVRCLETGITYASQMAAAKDMDLSPSRISDHINGRAENVSGYTFERVHIVSS